jgi:glutamine amidotransferase
MIALIDSGICNLASVIRALERIGAAFRVVREPAGLTGSNAIILPGVGAFGDGMAALRAGGFVEPLRAAARDGRIIFGICLGMQLLAEESEEHGRHEGLGLLPGRVRKLVADRPGFRVPNIGWCDVSAPRPGLLFPDVGKTSSFYFVHSYALEADEAHVAANIDFSRRRVAAAIEHRNLYGVQFHPEKSQDAGLDLLARWVAHVPRATAPA